MRRFLLIALILAVAVVQAQTVQNFSLLNVQTGKNTALQDYTKFKGVVIVFTSNDCPYDAYYADRLKELSKKYGEQVPFILINSNPEATESQEAMKAYIKRSGLDLPFVVDKDQVVFANLAPRKTPEAFLLQSAGGKFTVIYKGAIDDNAQSSDDVKNTYLDDRIGEFLAGKALTSAEERPVGCSIRKK